MSWNLSIRKNDTVKVMAGRDKGKVGRVLSVDPVHGRCFVEHVHMIKRHTRPNPGKNIKGGIVEREGAIDVSNIMIVCPSCNKPVRVGHSELADGRKVRVCHKCGTTLDK